MCFGGLPFSIAIEKGREDSGMTKKVVSLPKIESYVDSNGHETCMKKLNMDIRNTIRKLKDKMETSYSLPWREDFGGYLLQRGYLLYQNLFINRHWGFAAQLTYIIH